MDILLLSDVYFPRVNGVSSSIRTFARELTRQRHSVTLVAPRYRQDDDAIDSTEEFRIERVASRPVLLDPEDRLMQRGALRAIERRLALRRFDAIHVQTPFRAHALGRRLARATGAPHVETFHTHFEAYIALYLPWLPGAWLRRIARRICRTRCARADHLVVPTTQMNEVLGAYGIVTPTTVIPTGLVPDEFAAGDGARFRARHGIPRDRPVMATVSRLAREKNIDFLLDVAVRVRRRIPDVLFIVAGEGPHGAALEQRAAALGLGTHVRFFGNLDRATDLLDCYRAADVFVFASPTETQGLVLIEAMALGVPIVSTAVLGTAAVLAAARSAVVAPPDAESFAESVSAVLASAELRAMLASHGPSDARAWSAGPCAARLAELYASLSRAGEGCGPTGAERLASTSGRAPVEREGRLA